MVRNSSARRVASVCRAFGALTSTQSAERVQLPQERKTGRRCAAVTSSIIQGQPPPAFRVDTHGGGLSRWGLPVASLQTADRIGCRCAYFEVGIRRIKNRICMDYRLLLVGNHLKFLYLNPVFFPYWQLEQETMIRSSFDWNSRFSDTPDLPPPRGCGRTAQRDCLHMPVYHKNY